MRTAADGVGEEEEQAVTELLHDPGVLGQGLRHHPVLRGEQGERGLVARTAVNSVKPTRSVKTMAPCTTVAAVVVTAISGR